MTRLVPSVFPGRPTPGAPCGAKTPDLQESRRPDSNRGPLHYERSPAPPETGATQQDHGHRKAPAGTVGRQDVPSVFPDRRVDGLDAMRGIAFGLIVAVAFWLTIATVIYLAVTA